MRSFTIVVLIAYVSCMEMHETVERMVMVRTTGSDLNPAATGYIYKKNSDGPASVVEMGESEVVEHLSKIYEQPKSFTAPLPIVPGPFYSKNDNEGTAITSESRIIPVAENQEENNDPIDGIVSEDYGKFLEEYASDYGNYKSNFDEYLRNLEKLNDKIYAGRPFKEDYLIQHQDHDDYIKNDPDTEQQYNKENAADYHSAKYEMYQVSKDHGEHVKENADDDDKKINYNFQPNQYSQGKALDEYYKHFHANENPKDESFIERKAFKGETNDKLYKGHENNKSDVNRIDEKLYNSGKAGFGESDFYDKQNNDSNYGDKDAKASEQYFKEISFESGKHDSGSYGYKIKH